MGHQNYLKDAQKINLSRNDFQGGGVLKPSNDYDLYRVKLKRRSSFSLNLDSYGKKTNADVEIYGLKGSHRATLKEIGKTEFGALKRKDIRRCLRRLGRSKQKGRAHDSIETELEKGIYYVRVYQKRKRGKYELSLSTGTEHHAESVELTSPNGGENLLFGKTHPILWKNSTDQGMVKVDLYQGKTLHHTISAATPNDGHLDWTVPTTLQPGTQYTLKLTLDGNKQIASDVSDRPFFISDATDWFDDYIETNVLQRTARLGFADQSIDRSDMLNLFADVAADGRVEVNELKDLRTLVANHAPLGMANHVQVLSNKIVNGDSANTFYKGEILGDLSIGSSADHLNALVDKWFLGGDRPTAPDGFSMTYAQAKGSLFGTDNAPNLEDIRQGYLADCYLLSALGANALNQPETIHNMFIDNSDGTFTVKFYGQNNGKVVSEADYVTVDRWLPTNVSDDQYSGQSFAAFDENDRGLWVALAEKAYAQFAASSISFRPLPMNCYEGINYGKGFRAMAAISGNDGRIYTDMAYGTAQVGSFPAFETIEGLLNTNTPTVASTIDNADLGIVSNHQYIIVNTDSTTQTLKLYNPQGTRSNPQPGEDPQGFRTLSYRDFAANFDSIEFQTSETTPSWPQG